MKRTIITEEERIRILNMHSGNFRNIYEQSSNWDRIKGPQFKKEFTEFNKSYFQQNPKGTITFDNNSEASVINGITVKDHDIQTRPFLTGDNMGRGFTGNGKTFNYVFDGVRNIDFDGQNFYMYLKK